MSAPERRPDLRLVRPEKPQTAFNVAAEIAAWSTALEDPRSLTRALALGLAAEHFHEPENARVWEALATMAEQPDARIHPVLVAQWLEDNRRTAPKEGWIAYLRQEVTELAPIEELATLLIKLATVRGIGAEAEAIAAEAKNPIIDRDAWIDQAEERLRARRPRTRQSLQMAGELLPGILETVAKAEQGRPTGYLTGFDSIDRRLGGLFAAELLLLTGPEKKGKSSLALQMGAQIARAQEVGTLVIQWEDKAKKAMMRLTGARARVDLVGLRTGAWDRECTNRLALAADELAGLRMRIEDSIDATVSAIAKAVQNTQRLFAEAGYPLVTVIIDSLQLLEGPGNNREQQLENILKGLVRLKNAAQFSGISWVLVNHTNAEGDMVNAKAAPRRWANVWLHLSVDEKEDHEGAREAKLTLKLHRDLEAGLTFPFWVYRRCNNLFVDGGI